MDLEDRLKRNDVEVAETYNTRNNDQIIYLKKLSVTLIDCMKKVDETRQDIRHRRICKFRGSYSTFNNNNNNNNNDDEGELSGSEGGRHHHHQGELSLRTRESDQDDGSESLYSDEEEGQSDCDSLQSRNGDNYDSDNAKDGGEDRGVMINKSIKKVSHKTRSHSGDRPYKCIKCVKCFKTKTCLKQHFVIHTGEKPFKCHCCGKKFNDPSTLKNHRLTHTGVKEFKCKICDKKYSRKSHLGTHSLTHTLERPFICDKCGKGFAQQGHLSTHLLTHADGKLRCKYCKGIFRYKSSLTRHYLRGCGQ